MLGKAGEMVLLLQDQLVSAGDSQAVADALVFDADFALALEDLVRGHHGCKRR